jgi:hypothetical protein
MDVVADQYIIVLIVERNLIKLDVGISYFITTKPQIFELIRSLKSVYKYVNRIHLIDGRFTEFPGKPDYSIPECNEIIQSMFPKVEITKIQATQLVKRQAYLDATKADYLMVMDADDFVHPEHADWNRFYGELQEVYNEPELLYFLWFWVDKKWIASANPVCMETWQKYIRIHKHPNKQKYHMNHYTWRLKEDNSVNLNSLLTKKTLGGIKLTCDSIYRDDDFLKRKAEWEQTDYLKEQARAWIAFNKIEELSNTLFINKSKK